MVRAANRFKRSKPCPICGGFDSQQRGTQKRCYGFLSEDDNWAHCTREEYSGGLSMNTESETFAHKLFGDCHCGTQHNPEIKGMMINRIIKQYDYTDEHGELLYQVCRMNPKGFFQRQPDGKGGWINNLKGVRRVLYRLPELIDADKSATVFICEGEKDVDALCKLGLVATTNAGGAEKWRYEYNESLRACSVVILPDNDEVGHKHAAQVAKSLTGIAASVRVVELPDLPEKGDVSDWLKSGGTVEQLQEIVANAANCETERLNNSTVKIQSATDLLAREIPEPKYAVNGLLSEGVTIFAGKPKLGKSWLGLGMAVAVASGGHVLGAIPVKQGDVLYLALEDGERRLQERLQKVIGNGSIPEKLDFATEWKRLNEGGIEHLEEWLNAHPDARLIIIDTLKRVRQRGRSKAQLYDIDYEALEPLGELGRKYGISIVVIHHTRKADSEDPLELISGSFGLSGSADGALILKRPRGQGDAVLNSTGRDFEEQEIALKWDEVIYGWNIVGDAQEIYLTKERREIIDLLEIEKTLTPKEAARLLNRKDASTRKLMLSMMNDGQLHNDGSGTYSLPVNRKSSNYGNSGNTTYSGNSGNFDSKTANPRQSYLKGFEAGNSVSDSDNSNLDGRVTEVTPITPNLHLDDEAAERAAIIEYDGNIPREEAEALALNPTPRSGRVSTQELFGSEDEDAKAA